MPFAGVLSFVVLSQPCDGSSYSLLWPQKQLHSWLIFSPKLSISVSSHCFLLHPLLVCWTIQLIFADWFCIPCVIFLQPSWSCLIIIISLLCDQVSLHNVALNWACLVLICQIPHQKVTANLPFVLLNCTPVSFMIRFAPASHFLWFSVICTDHLHFQKFQGSLLSWTSITMDLKPGYRGMWPDTTEN